jgi:hypothetical protein
MLRVITKEFEDIINVTFKIDFIGMKSEHKFSYCYKKHSDNESFTEYPKFGKTPLK